MRAMVFVLVLIASLMSMGIAHADDKDALPEVINLNEPPFWMASYDEFHDFQPFQKDFYLEKLGTEIRKVPSMENTSQVKLEEATDWHTGWVSISRKLYRACKDKANAVACERVADVRLQALDKLSNQKEMNRKANELKSSKKSVKSK